MAPPTDRKEILAGFRKQIDSGTAIVGAGAGMSDYNREPGCFKIDVHRYFFQESGSQPNLRKLAVSR
jgi:hypothetical protein